jgi:hypothetical protein
MFTEPGWQGAAFNLSQPGHLPRLLRLPLSRQARSFLKSLALGYGCGRGYASQFVDARRQYSHAARSLSLASRRGEPVNRPRTSIVIRKAIRT